MPRFSLDNLPQTASRSPQTTVDQGYIGSQMQGLLQFSLIFLELYQLSLRLKTSDDKSFILFSASPNYYS
jgi:hypothetical protein